MKTTRKEAEERFVSILRPGKLAGATGLEPAASAASRAGETPVILSGKLCGDSQHPSKLRVIHSNKRRACDESSYRLHQCSGSAPWDVSARALYPQLRPGGIAGPPREDTRFADQWVRVLPRPAFERRPRPRRDRAETLRARRVGGGPLLLRARTRGARAH